MDTGTVGTSPKLISASLIEHDGGSSRGSGGDFVRYVDVGTTIIVLSNQDAEYMLFGARLKDAIAQIVLGHDLQPPPQVVENAQPSLEEYRGEYQFADSSTLRIDHVDTLLELRGTGQMAIGALLGFNESEAAFHAQVSERTTELLSSIVDGDYSALVNAPEGSVGPGLAEMFASMKSRSGDPTGFHIHGTVPPTGVSSADAMTLLTIAYPDGPKSFRFYWANGGDRRTRRRWTQRARPTSCRQRGPRRIPHLPRCYNSLHKVLCTPG